MTESSPAVPHPPRAPLHFWAVGVLLVLWNCWGLAGAVAAQARLRPGMPADASDYFESSRCGLFCSPTLARWMLRRGVLT